jgi:hypothetical protein
MARIPRLEYSSLFCELRRSLSLGCMIEAFSGYAASREWRESSPSPSPASVHRRRATPLESLPSVRWPAGCRLYALAGDLAGAVLDESRLRNARNPYGYAALRHSITRGHADRLSTGDVTTTSCRRCVSACVIGDGYRWDQPVERFTGATAAESSPAPVATHAAPAVTLTRATPVPA